jgi:putative CocE/NonD family hydrolase
MTTRDGTRLFADVYRPDDDGAYPCLVQRTPYDKLNMLYTFAATIDPTRAVERGYAVVVQDCRGRFGSEGEWHPFVHEADDGYDTVEWLAQQPWCDGRVGVYGNSYMATTALQAAIAAPPHLAAVFSYMGGPAYHDGWAYTNGVLELGFDYFWLTRGAWETLRRSDVGPDSRRELAAVLHSGTTQPAKVIAQLPVEKLPGLVPELVPFWQTWLEHPGYDEYWRSFDVVERADAIEVPVCHVSGLYDNFLQGHLALNAALSTHRSERVRRSHQFVLGPWDHEAYMGARPSAAGLVDFTPNAPNSYRLCHDLALDWFDRWLLDGEPDAVGVVSRYFDTGTQAWHEVESWPPSAVATDVYLDGSGAANSRFGDGLLVWDAPRERVADAFTYDPLDPVPTVGGRTLAPVFGQPGIQDQRTVEERPDVLVYTCGELESDLVVAGPVSVTLYVSTDGEDTDFTAKLVEVEPDGFCRNIAEGIVRARYRNGWEASFLEPGETVELSIPLLDVAHTFAAGSRLRVEVSSSNFPRFDRNLNTRVSPARGGPEDVRVALQQVFHGGDTPSCVQLPVVRERSES